MIEDELDEQDSNNLRGSLKEHFGNEGGVRNLEEALQIISSWRLVSRSSKEEQAKFLNEVLPEFLEEVRRVAGLS